MALNMSVLTLCKFTPLGFETKIEKKTDKELIECKFTPLGFETRWAGNPLALRSCVNLPRWGLKLTKKIDFSIRKKKCKFTPLGFETFSRLLSNNDSRV